MSVDEDEDGYEDAADLGLPRPPWQRATKPRRSAPRPQLSRRAIVEAALLVLRNHGGEGLTMRRVADELGSGAASLYGYVANKEELIQLILDRLLGEVKVPEPDPAHWQEQIKDYMGQVREVMRRHPGTGRLTLGRIPMGPRFMLQAEALFAILRAGGLPDWLCGYAGDLFGLYVGAFEYEQDIGHSFQGDVDMEDGLTMMRDYVASLPPDRFPNTVALAGAMFEGTADERFNWGVDLLVRGLATYADKRRAGRQGGRKQQ